MRIDFSGMAEPWANPDCTRMLRYTLESGFKVAVYTTLYGITETEGNEIIGLLRANAPLVDIVCLHLPDANENMRGWKFSEEWQNVFINFVALAKEGTIPRFEVMTMDGSGQLHGALAHLTIRLGRWFGHSRAGALADDAAKSQSFFKPPPSHTSAVTCSMTPFYDHNVMLPNGDVVLCCMDYNLKHIIGNLFTQSYSDLFTGEGLNRLRIDNMTPGQSKCSICKSCDWAVNLKIGDENRWANA